MEKKMTDENALDILENYEKPVDLTTIRQRAHDLRNAYLKKLDLEDQLKRTNYDIKKIERDELPEMFTKAGVSSVTVEASGNHPAFVAERETVYTAKIPDEKRQDAFEWFEQQGHGDLVKSVINIIFGMQEHEERLRVMEILAKNNVEYYTNESVHHQTLKAFVKREILKGHIIPMDLLGVYVFDEVKIK
jgi:hypothetical protein